MNEQEYMFYTLQQQFMQMNVVTLTIIYYNMNDNNLYVKNKYTPKIEKIISKRLLDTSHKDLKCLATHLALQMSGIDAQCQGVFMTLYSCILFYSMLNGLSPNLTQAIIEHVYGHDPLNKQFIIRNSWGRASLFNRHEKIQEELILKNILDFGFLDNPNMPCF